ncbi:hypothetical protein [Halomonas sp. 328]|uniref:hypothetical protein n=1 Tax=Halomonas sp. 328 TaxID=2776704 RepID=UPI0018A6E827|nr:hypothetical protein [Halomonas sp. 328]MBF8224207.1 hypothetical protein [Halomonas sp. 328]
MSDTNAENAEESANAENAEESANAENAEESANAENAKESANAENAEESANAENAEESANVSISKNQVTFSMPTSTSVALGATNFAYVGQKGFHSIGARADVNLDFVELNWTVVQTGKVCKTTGPLPWYHRYSHRGNENNYYYGNQENHYCSGSIRNIYYLNGGGRACTVSNFYKKPEEEPEAEVKLMSEVEGTVQVECEYYVVKAANAAVGACSEYRLSPNFAVLFCTDDTDEKGAESYFCISSKEIESEAKTISIKSSDGPSIEVSSTGILLKFNDSTYIKLSNAGVEIKGSIINLNN